MYEAVRASRQDNRRHGKADTASVHLLILSSVPLLDSQPSLTTLHCHLTMTFEKDIIDLTADLSDLEATPTLSSARKRSRQAPASVMEADQKKAKNCSSTKRRNKAKRVRLIGEPFVIKATEKHYRAVQYADMSIEVREAISSARWLTSGQFHDHL